MIDVISNCRAAWLSSGVAAANEETLFRTVLQESCFWTRLAHDNQNQLTLLVVEMGMDMGQTNLADPILDEIDEVQLHLVFVWETISADPENFAIIGNPDEQCVALGVQKPSNCLKRRQMHLSSGWPVCKLMRSVDLNSTAPVSPQSDLQLRAVTRPRDIYHILPVTFAFDYIIRRECCKSRNR